MVEGGFEDYEMEYLGRNYLEYDEMTREESNDEYGRLTQKRLNLLRNDIEPEDEQFVDVKKR